MSDLIQAGHHPDGDQLNAFVEHTLPAHEQEQTLAHLAFCPACRQIVALSLPPGDELSAQRPEADRHRWFPRWHPAWMGIPALAALALLVVLIHTGGMTARKTAVPAQTADVRPPVAPPAVSSPPETARNAPPHAFRSNQKSAVATQARPEARPEPAGGVMGGILGGLASAPMQQPAQRGSTCGAPSASAGGPLRAVAVDPAQSVFSTQSPLPSHLAILSMTSHANQRLAIDSANQLFLSEDEGRHWKTIPSPWEGRAVSVALTSAAGVGDAAAALKMSSRPAASTASTLSGTIQDPSGAVIPGATVTATNSSGALVGSATTGSQGQYRMEDLAPGSYHVEAQARGFDKQSFTAELAPSQEAVADATLRVGSAAQTVTVEAAPPSLDSSPVDATLSPASQTPSRFELTTDAGERWTSIDGQTWARE